MNAYTLENRDEFAADANLCLDNLLTKAAERPDMDVFSLACVMIGTPVSRETAIGVLCAALLRLNRARANTSIVTAE